MINNLPMGTVMQQLRYSSMYGAIALLMGIINVGAYAAENPSLPPQDRSPEVYRDTTDEIKIDRLNGLSTELPSEDTGSVMSKAESIAYLKANPKEFETLLGNLLRQGNAESLEELLPVYQQVPNYDPSVVDWGNAIIAAKNGRLDEAVRRYREVNARLPEIKILRFQLAMALFFNRQYDAAQSEFERLRATAITEADTKVINQYLDAINDKDRWSFNGSVSYINDGNISNSPEEGTQFVAPNGSITTFTSPREEGEGVTFRLSGNKKWINDNKIFTSLGLNTNGRYYWDNKKYNDVTAGISTGIGYQNAITEVELQPFYNKRWYGQGRSGDGDLKSYADTTGVRLNLSQFITPKIRYQGVVSYSDSDYIDRYAFNDGSDLVFANTALYFPTGQQFWILGLDYATRDTEDTSISFDRTGLRLGLGQTWGEGYTTRFDLGYAERDYESEDFFGIERKNKEYSAGITAWNRGFSVLGLTPRLSWDYVKVDSNSPFEEYDKHNVSLELTKAF